MQNRRPGFRLFLAVMFFLIQSSCKTYEFFSMDVLEPAIVDISPGIKKVVVMHNFSPENRDSTGTRYQIYDQVVYDTLYIDTLLGRYAINSLSDALNNVGRFEAVPVDSTGWVFPSHQDLFTQKDLEHIRRICEEHQADAMILLNSAEKKVIYDLYYSDFGSYFSGFTVFLNTRWLMINPFTSRLLDEITSFDTVSFQSTGLLFDYGFEPENIRHEYMMESFATASLRYSERISPHYASTDRIIFTRGNKFLKKGYQEALAGNWENAAIIWDKSLDRSDPKSLSKACFNLALANEMEGMLSEALEWAQESRRLFPDTINQTYIYILKRRLEEQDKIMIQMDGNK